MDKILFVSIIFTFFNIIKDSLLRNVKKKRWIVGLFWNELICVKRHETFNSLPNDNMLDKSKLKGFASDKINVTVKSKFVLGRVENIVGKGENAGYQHFLLYPKCFQKTSFSGSFKVGIVWYRVKRK